MEKTENLDFIVECNVCKQRLINHVGSTPCCGSIAYIVENDEVTDRFTMYKYDEDKNELRRFNP